MIAHRLPSKAMQFDREISSLEIYGSRGLPRHFVWALNLNNIQARLLPKSESFGIRVLRLDDFKIDKHFARYISCIKGTVRRRCESQGQDKLDNRTNLSRSLQYNKTHLR